MTEIRRKAFLTATLIEIATFAERLNLLAPELFF